MVEQEVDVEIAVADFKVELASDKGEALAEFQQEAFELVQQIGLQFPLMERLFEGQEIKDVGVFERLLHQIGLRRGQQPLEVREGLSLPAMSL